jgi:hypothetical protein
MTNEGRTVAASRDIVGAGNETRRGAEKEAPFRIEAETLRHAAKELARKRGAAPATLSPAEQPRGRNEEETRKRAKQEERFPVEVETLRRAAEELARRKLAGGVARRSVENGLRAEKDLETRGKEGPGGRSAQEEARWRTEAEATRRLVTEEGTKQAAESARLAEEEALHRKVAIKQTVFDPKHPTVDQSYAAVPTSNLKRLSSPDVTERAAALEELARSGGEDSFRLITDAFDDPLAQVRSAAACALHDLQPNRAASFTRALREATPERRRRIGGALANSGLAAEAINNLSGEIREKTYGAFSLLFLMAKAGEFQPLMSAIEDYHNIEVRLAVIKLLALTGQPEVVPAFRRLAVRGSLPAEVRSAVMEAIYQISCQARETAPSSGLARKSAVANSA